MDASFSFRFSHFRHVLNICLIKCINIFDNSTLQKMLINLAQYLSIITLQAKFTNQTPAEKERGLLKGLIRLITQLNWLN